MILYPTETVYGLGVNALDEAELKRLFTLKGRDERQTVSWLVRDLADIERYAVLSPRAVAIAERWLPGPLTLVLPARDEVSRRFVRTDGTVSFRISADQIAQQTGADFMAEYDAPLTCTSANVSGQPALRTPTKIIEQFKEAGKDISMIYRTIDDGVRAGDPSTVVRVVDDAIEILRDGSVKTADIMAV